MRADLPGRTPHPQAGESVDANRTVGPHEEHEQRAQHGEACTRRHRDLMHEAGN